MDKVKEHRRVGELESRIAAILAGEHPGAQGAVLACLTAAWIAGHHPSLREGLLQIHADGVRKLIQVYDHWPKEERA